MLQRGVRWFEDELPKLVSLGVINEDAAESLRRYYGISSTPTRRTPIWIFIFGVFGATLIGLGLILLVASNWEFMSRPMRTVWSLLPLICSQALGLWVLNWKSESQTWKEGCAAFQFISIGASISLIAQTYNIHGDLGRFLLTWSLLGFPLIYLMDSGICFAFYMIGITWFAGARQIDQGHALLYWPCAALTIPFIWQCLRADRYSPKSLWTSWVLALALTIGTGIALEKTVPGLWMIVYLGLFATFYLVGGYWFSDASSLWQKPFHAIGAGGIFFVSLLLTYENFWDHVGWNCYRYGHGYHEWAALMDYLLAALLPFASIFLLVQAVRREQAGKMLYGIAPILGILAYCSMSFIPGLFLVFAVALFNLYAFCLSMGTIRAGIERGQAVIMNGGLITLIILIGARFVDTDLPFTLRGIGFILLGGVFLGSNLYLIRKKEAQS